MYDSRDLPAAISTWLETNIQSIEEIRVKPKKSDIEVASLVLAGVPQHHRPTLLCGGIRRGSHHPTSFFATAPRAFSFQWPGDPDILRLLMVMKETQEEMQLSLPARAGQKPPGSGDMPAGFGPQPPQP
jgi:hypothetical protein